MSGLSPAWSVRKSGVDYVTKDNDCQIIHRTNAPSEAKMVFDNSDRSLMSVFSEEDEVTIKIGSTAMMQAFIDDIEDVHNPDNTIDLILTLIDWGSYYAAKKAFEKNYQKTTTARQVFIDSGGMISLLNLGGISLTGLNTTNEQLKKEFSGTYVKDGWDEAAQQGGADFFVDENKILQAWPIGTRDLTESSTGLRYKIIDGTPFGANQLRVRFDDVFGFKRSVSGKYRTVYGTSGIDETYPSDIDLASTLQVPNPFAGVNYSGFFDSLGPISGFAVGKYPFKFIASQNVAGATFPTIQLIYPAASGSVLPAFFGRTYDGSGNQVIQVMGINPVDWQSLRFIMKNALTGNTVTKIEMRLITRSSGAYWSRDIYPDLINQAGARNDFVFLNYDITPAALNTWTKSGSPSTIDLILFIFTPSSGYAADSYIEFSKFYFYRKQRKSATVGGSPATEKIIVNASMKNPTSLQNFVNKELTRVSQTAKQPYFTIDGNVNFKKPGYAIDVDFSNVFDANRIGTAIRMDEIRHDLKAGVHWTSVYLDTSFNRK